MLPRPMLSWTVRALLITAALFVWGTPLPAQDFSGAAKVLVMTGRVSIFRDNNEWALNAGSVVQPKQVIVTGDDGYAKFELSDGSTFEVFQNSRAVFRPNPGLLELLDLWIGHIKVYIQHKNGPNYNRVTTQTAVISVRGTVFDVDAEDESTTFISVDEGLVGVRHTRFPGNEVLLHPGESTRVYRDQPLARSIDKGGIGRQALRVAAQAVYDTLARRGTGSTPTGTSTGTSTGGAQGDKGKGGSSGSGSGSGAPPPPPPPPPPGN